MKTETYYKAILLMLLILLLIPNLASSADRLVVKNDSAVVTFNVADDGTVYATQVGVGTATPAFPLEIETTGENALLQLDRTDGASFKLNVTANKGQLGTQSSHKLVLTTGNLARLAIDTNGYVGISDNSPDYPLDMGTVGNGAHCTTGGVWTNGSSRASKENIKSLTAHEALDTLQGLDPVRFNYKAEEEEQYVGFIAEDVPELVATNDRKTLSPMDIVGVLTKVVQEQQETITELSRKLAGIEGILNVSENQN